jgi:hypothetical protein
LDDHDFLGTLETTISLSSGDSAPVDSEYRERLEAEEAKRTILEEQARRHRNNAERWEMAKSEMGKLMGGSLLDSLEGAPELSDVELVGRMRLPRASPSAGTGGKEQVLSGAAAVGDARGQQAARGPVGGRAGVQGGAAAPVHGGGAGVGGGGGKGCGVQGKRARWQSSCRRRRTRDTGQGTRELLPLCCYGVTLERRESDSPV